MRRLRTSSARRPSCEGAPKASQVGSRKDPRSNPSKLARPSRSFVAASGWLPHTTRAALTGLRKRGYVVTIDRADKARASVYRVEPSRRG